MVLAGSIREITREGNKRMTRVMISTPIFSKSNMPAVEVYRHKRQKIGFRIEGDEFKMITARDIIQSPAGFPRKDL